MIFKSVLRFLYSMPFGKNFTKRVLLNDIEKTFLGFGKVGYFPDTGWINSWQQKKPVDPHGNPQPWFCYSTNRFIESRLNKKMSVFEFGSGNSTLFIGPKVGELVSIEHNKEWFDQSDSKPYKNTQIHYCPLDEKNLYSKFPSSLNQKFDLIIIDGRKRVESAQTAVNCLSETGVILFDDSQRKKYLEGINFIKNQGFKSLDFWGLALGDYGLKSTTIFYRKENCLGI